MAIANYVRALGGVAKARNPSPGAKAAKLSMDELIVAALKEPALQRAMMREEDDE